MRKIFKKIISVSLFSVITISTLFGCNSGSEEETTPGVNVADMTPEEYYKKLNFKTLKAYEMDLKKRASISVILSKLDDDTQVKKYSDKDIEVLYESVKKQVESAASAYSMSADEYIKAAYGMSAEDFKKEYIETTLKPASKIQMLVYAIFDKEKMTCTEDEKNLKIDDIIKQYSGTSTVTSEQVREAYGDFGIEYSVVEEKVFDFLYEKAVVK